MSVIIISGDPLRKRIAEVELKSADWSDQKRSDAQVAFDKIKAELDALLA